VLLLVVVVLLLLLLLLLLTITMSPHPDMLTGLLASSACHIALDFGGLS
jgi:hypothetical protein